MNNSSLRYQILNQLAVACDYGLELPDYVKTASLEDIYPAKSTTAFADDEKLYPCHTKAATWVSSLRFAASDNHDEKTRKNLLEACEIYGLISDVGDVYLRRKTAEAPKDECVVRMPDGRKYCPVTDTETAVKAAAWLEQNREAVPYAIRREAAIAILNKVAEIPDDTKIVLERIAGRGIPSFEKVAEQLVVRCRAAREPQVFELAVKLRETIKHADLTHEDTRLKLAEIIDDFDRGAAFSRNNYKSRKLANITMLAPEEWLFAVTPRQMQKAAEDIVFAKTGEVYSLEDLAKIPEKMLKTAFGSDAGNYMTNGVTDAAKIAAAISADSKVAKIIAACGKASGLSRLDATKEAMDEKTLREFI